MKYLIIKFIWLFVTCVSLFSCEKKEDMGEQVLPVKNFTVNSSYIKLSEDSTNTAGILQITALTPEVKLKWNVLPECNIDTTVTSLTLTNGRGELPIRWEKRLSNGKFNIQERIFDAGVEIISGEEAKYVHLVWADGIDSVALSKPSVTTRASGISKQEAIILNINPQMLSMDRVVGGAVSVTFSGIDFIIVDQSKVEEFTNIDKVSIPLVIEKSGPLIFNWNTLGAPQRDFIATVTLFAGDIFKDLYLKYTINPEEPAYWEYLYSIPENNSHIPAKDASIRVNVKTNKKWGVNSIQSSFPIEENATSLGTKQLTIDIDDNPGTMAREVKVNVTSEGTVKEILTFIQEAPNATFEFLSANPEDNTIVTGGTLNVTIKVRTDHEWWIQYDGKKYNFEAGPLGIKEGSILIPVNTNDEVRNLTVIVGYDDKVGKIINYYQEPSNGGDGTSFNFISANPATNATISSMGATAIVKVNTDYEWWIQINGVKTTFPAGVLGEKEGTINIPANTTTSSQVVTYTVGYGNITAQTINYIQPGIGSDTGLTYVSSNLPTGNIPQSGGTYQFTFTGSYTGGVQLRTLFDNVAQEFGSVATNKKPEITVAANNDEVRNVTFEYKLDIGDWMALPASTNRQQDARNGGGGDTQTLTYVSSTLPTGNIPAAGSVYTFNFEGGYTGQLRVRAVEEATGTVLFNGPIGTTHSPKVTVPANTVTATRNIKFQYRLIDVAGSTFTDLPTSTNRVQDGGTGGAETGPITFGPILPAGTIWAYGGEYTCVFSGGPGTVMMRAMKLHDTEANSILAGITKKVNIPSTEPVKLTIDELKGFNATVTFEYSIDGGKTWLSMNDSRRQINETIIAKAIDVDIAATNGKALIRLQGTYSKPITVTGFLQNTEERVAGSATGYASPAGTILEVPILDNPGPERNIYFSFPFGDAYYHLGNIKQLAK